MVWRVPLRVNETTEVFIDDTVVDAADDGADFAADLGDIVDVVAEFDGIDYATPPFQGTTPPPLPRVVESHVLLARQPPPPVPEAVNCTELAAIMFAAFLARCTIGIHMDKAGTGDVVWDGCIAVVPECEPVAFMRALAKLVIAGQKHAVVHASLWELLSCCNTPATTRVLVARARAFLSTVGRTGQAVAAESFLWRWSHVLRAGGPCVAVIDMRMPAAPAVFSPVKWATQLFEADRGGSVPQFSDANIELSTLRVRFVRPGVAMTNEESAVFWSRRVVGTRPTKLPTALHLFHVMYTHLGHHDVVERWEALMQEAVL